MCASKTSEATPVILCVDLVARVLSSDPRTTWRSVDRPVRLGGTLHDLHSQ